MVCSSSSLARRYSTWVRLTRVRASVRAIRSSGMWKTVGLWSPQFQERELTDMGWFFSAAWTQHTGASLRMAGVIDRARGRMGWSRKEFAYYLGETESSLSRQMSGERGFNLWKLANLGNAFLLAYLHELAATIGAEVIEATELRELVGAVKGLAALHPVTGEKGQETA